MEFPDDTKSGAVASSCERAILYVNENEPDEMTVDYPVLQ